MNTEILTKILFLPFKGTTRDKSAKYAKELGFTMYEFNGDIYSVTDGKFLFKRSDLIKQ